MVLVIVVPGPRDALLVREAPDRFLLLLFGFPLQV